MSDDLWSGSITFTGLGSGTDFDSIVESLMKVESYRLNQMEDWKESWELKQEALSTLNTALVSFQSTLEGLDTVNEFMTKSVSNTNTTALSATADADADEDSHTVVINQLAANDVWVNYGYGYSSSSEVITTSDASLSFTYAGESYTIDAPAGTTLQTLANIINSDADLDGGVKASIISDGDEYYLELRGMDLGADNTLTIDSSTIPGFSDTSNFVQLQEACDCQVKVDGFPPGDGNWIETDSNVLTDVIDGVTLTLKDTTGSDGVLISIAVDTDQVVENVTTLVDQMNTIRSMIQDLTEYDESTKEGSVLTGNYGVQMVGQSLKDIIAGIGNGFMAYDSDTDVGDLICTLSQLGITTDTEESSTTFGLLVIDEDELTEALEENPDAVAELFAADGLVESRSDDMTVTSTISGITEAGNYDVQYTVTGGVLASATVDGYTCVINDNTFTVMDGPATGMVIRADDLTDGDHSGEVSIKQGKIGELVDKLDELTDPSDGTLVIIEDNYQDIVDNLDDKIAWEEDRLAKKEEALQERFARLEELLITYEGISDELESSLDKLE